jgi:hypothetical protein
MFTSFLYENSILAHMIIMFNFIINSFLSLVIYHILNRQEHVYTKRSMSTSLVTVRKVTRNYKKQKKIYKKNISYALHEIY